MITSLPGWKPGSLPAPRQHAHLVLEPLLQIIVVGLHQGLIVAPHLLQHPAQVHGGLSVQLNLELVPQLALQNVDFLWA